MLQQCPSGMSAAPWLLSLQRPPQREKGTGSSLSLYERNGTIPLATDCTHAEDDLWINVSLKTLSCKGRQREDFK